MTDQALMSRPRRARWATRSVAITAGAWAIAEILKPLWTTVPDDPIQFAEMTPLASAGAYVGASAALIAMVGFAVSAVLLIAWEYRTIRAANLVGIPTELSPVEAVVWWFVPVLNLWKPYAVVKALGAALAPGTRRTIAVWWAAHLLTTAFIYLTDASPAVAQVARFGGFATVLVAATSLTRVIRSIDDGLDGAARRTDEREAVAV